MGEAMKRIWNTITRFFRWVDHQFNMHEHDAETWEVIRRSFRNERKIISVGTLDSPATRAELEYIDMRIREGLGINRDAIGRLSIVIQRMGLQMDDVSRIWDTSMHPKMPLPSQKTIEWEERWAKR